MGGYDRYRCVWDNRDSAGQKIWHVQKETNNNPPEGRIVWQIRKCIRVRRGTQRTQLNLFSAARAVGGKLKSQSWSAIGGHPPESSDFAEELKETTDNEETNKDKGKNRKKDYQRSTGKKIIKKRTTSKKVRISTRPSEANEEPRNSPFFFCPFFSEVFDVILIHSCFIFYFFFSRYFR